MRRPSGCVFVVQVLDVVLFQSRVHCGALTSRSEIGSDLVVLIEAMQSRTR